MTRAAVSSIGSVETGPTSGSVRPEGVESWYLFIVDKNNVWVMAVGLISGMVQDSNGDAAVAPVLATNICQVVWRNARASYLERAVYRGFSVEETKMELEIVV